MLRLHQQMRDSVGMMAVGVDVPRGDTIAEEGASAVTSMAGVTSAKDATKQLGDVRCAHSRNASFSALLRSTIHS